MKKALSMIAKAGSLFFIASCYTSVCLARVGGAGGHNSHTSHSSGGSGSHGGGGGSIGTTGIVVILVILVIGYLMKKKKANGNQQNMGNMSAGNQASGVGDELMKGLQNTLSGSIVGSVLGGALGSLLDDQSGGGTQVIGNKNFPEGLTPQKVTTSFMELQNAWQQQDLSKVRKWMSDGVYQRFNAQFSMMKKLTQKNLLSNIRIQDISVADIRNDGLYQSADIAITFSIDDQFVCEKYPSLNESYRGDRDTEYWTFIKRADGTVKQDADLYSGNNCPNCGASLENQLGEVSRCGSCKTLVNNATYDWVLNEITQDEDYTRGNRLMNDQALKELVKQDPLFAIQRMEDIASNVFMQIMEVLGGDNNKKLQRFADEAVANKIIQQKQQNSPLVFDRLYLNFVTLSQYNTNDQKLNLIFDLMATYKRVEPGDRLRNIDGDFSAHRYRLTLSKDLNALHATEKEIAFSYECANCGAPYDDTTNAACTYCDAPVVDTAKDWVLTGFEA